MKKILFCFTCALLLPLGFKQSPKGHTVGESHAIVAPERLTDGSLPVCTPAEPCGPHLNGFDGHLAELSTSTGGGDRRS